MIEDETVRSPIYERGLTGWGFNVTSVDQEVMGTKWDAAIQELVAPELQHFARTGVAAIVGSLPDDTWDDALIDLFGTNLFEYPEPPDILIGSSRLLYDRGITVIAAVKAATDLMTAASEQPEPSEQQEQRYILKSFEVEGSTSHATYGLSVHPAVWEAERDIFESVFPVQASGQLPWVGMDFDQEIKGQDLANPNVITFYSELKAGPTQQNPKAVFAAFSFNDRPYDNKVIIEAGRNTADKGSFSDFTAPDTNFRGMKVFTRLINRSLQSLPSL